MWTITKHHERIEEFTGTSNLKHLYRNELNKTCFAHDAAYSDIKDLAKRTISDAVLKDRANEIARIYKYDAYQRALASAAYKFFDKKRGSGISVNEQIAEELDKTVIKNLKEEMSMQIERQYLGRKFS